jgi:hypothetical protein
MSVENGTPSVSMYILLHNHCSSTLQHSRACPIKLTAVRLTIENYLKYRWGKGTCVSSELKSTWGSCPFHLWMLPCLSIVILLPYNGHLHISINLGHGSAIAWVSGTELSHQLRDLRPTFKDSIDPLNVPVVLSDRFTWLEWTNHGINTKIGSLAESPVAAWHLRLQRHTQQCTNAGGKELNKQTVEQSLLAGIRV